uniref:DNA polymerase beta n=1 Tax=viral metagenome TaxID=1070528 RepID=A0A6C0E9U1_9ZZZZ
MSVNKELLISQFKLLSKQITYDIDFSTGKNKIANMFRLNTVNKIIKIFEKINKKNISIDDIKDLKGIGKGTIERVKELIKTGKLSEVKISSENEQYLKYIEELEEIFGIGRKTAYKLFSEYGIKSIDDLKKLHKSGKITLPDNVIKGLKYIGKIQDKIPREEIDQVHEYLLKKLYELDINLFGTVCGSYRRLQKTSGDVDFIMVHSKLKTKDDMKNHNYLKDFVELLIKDGFLIDILTGTDVNTKFMGIYQLNKDLPLRRIDIRFIPYESYYYAILYFTGSRDFNRKMRQIAINNGYTLNEYGLFDGEKMFKVSSEKEIFELLDMEYLTPDKR